MALLQLLPMVAFLTTSVGNGGDQVAEQTAPAAKYRNDQTPNRQTIKHSQSILRAQRATVFHAKWSQGYLPLMNHYFLSASPPLLAVTSPSIVHSIFDACVITPTEVRAARC
jgi:hypothetical protein